MPTSRLDPATSALVLIDHQVGTLQLVKTQDPKDAVRFAVALAKAAKALGLPVVFTTSQEGHLQGATVPELQQALPEAYAARVRRQGIVNAWDDPTFRGAVEATGRRQLVMAALTTDICLVFPAIFAVEDGFQVHAALDASGSPFPLSEDLARGRMRDAGVTLAATNTILAEWAGDWSSEAGAALIQILWSNVLPPVQAQPLKAAA